MAAERKFLSSACFTRQRRNAASETNALINTEMIKSRKAIKHVFTSTLPKAVNGVINVTFSTAF